jgi:two-component system phosphate regulon sensor histidine kinase PhoR
MSLRADQRLFLSYIALIVGLVATLTLGADMLLRRSLVQMVEDDLRRELALAVALHRASGGVGAV